MAQDEETGSKGANDENVDNDKVNGEEATARGAMASKETVAE